ncbi:MAG: hypothetical protein J6N54_01065 [Bacteroidales bacterium]|nr:hypothetical protein [Bacteroidales bacterium]
MERVAKGPLQERLGKDLGHYDGCATTLLQEKKLKATDMAAMPWDEKQAPVPRGTSSRERKDVIAKRLGIKP